MTTFSAAAAILLAAVIGFAIHRASLCNVRAVAEVLSTRRGFMLARFSLVLSLSPSSPGWCSRASPTGLLSSTGGSVSAGYAIEQLYEVALIRFAGSWFRPIKSTSFHIVCI